MEATTNTVSMHVSDAAGTENAPRPILESVIVPCCTKVVCAWVLATKYTADVSQIGISRSSVLSSSTCVTVHSLHGLPSSKSALVTTAALSKHLNCSVCSSNSRGE